MKKLSASGAIGLLLTMLIIALLFIMLMPSIKSSGGTNLDASPIKQESLEVEVNQKLNEIQNMRNQSLNINHENY